MAHYEDCKFFIRSTCVKGNHCPFRHSQEASNTDRVCISWASGYVCDGRCKQRHPSSVELAAATFSSSSRLSLPLPSTSTAAPAAGSGSTSTPPTCRFYGQGRCRNGDTCSFLHTPQSNPGTQTPQKNVSTSGATASNAHSAVTVDGAGAPLVQSSQSQPMNPPTLRAAAEMRRNAIAVDRQGDLTSTDGDGLANVGTNAVHLGGGANNAAAARARAADILQKHRLTSSASALLAGKRGGLEVKGVFTKVAPKRSREGQPRSDGEQDLSTGSRGAGPGTAFSRENGNDRSGFASDEEIMTPRLATEPHGTRNAGFSFQRKSTAEANHLDDLRAVAQHQVVPVYKASAAESFSTNEQNGAVPAVESSPEVNAARPSSQARAKVISKFGTGTGYPRRAWSQSMNIDVQPAAGGLMNEHSAEHLYHHDDEEISSGALGTVFGAKRVVPDLHPREASVGGDDPIVDNFYIDRFSAKRQRRIQGVDTAGGEEEVESSAAVEISPSAASAISPSRTAGQVLLTGGR